MDENTNTERGFGEVTEREEIFNDVDQTEDTQDEQLENDSDESTETEVEETDDQSTETENEIEETDEDSQETKLTDKGTKLDPNPKSAVHQQLANERKIRGQMEQVFASPELMSKFMKDQFDINVPLRGQKIENSNQSNGAEVKPTAKKWVAKDFENIEDIADVVNGIQEKFDSQLSERDLKIDKLTKDMGGIQEGGRVKAIADSIEKDVVSLRNLPELNPKSPEFISGLEEEIGALYHKLDFDEASGMYRGKVSMQELGATIISTAKTGRKAGSKQAQTIVQDKTGGKIRTGKNTNKDVVNDNLPPGESIAQGIAKMFKNQ